VTNKDTVAEFFTHLNKGHQAAALAMLRDDCVWVVPSSIPGGGEKSKQAFADLLSGILQLFASGPRFEIVSVTAEDDRVAIEMIGRGALRSGRQYENRYQFLMRLEDRKIIRVHEYVDTHYSMTVAFAP
jgi:ketosteroid isomerase-like protein